MPQPLTPDAQRVARRRPHYVAATFYALIALVGVIVAIGGTPSTLVVSLLAGLYSTYLFRGGRIVVWIW